MSTNQGKHGLGQNGRGKLQNIENTKVERRHHKRNINKNELNAAVTEATINAAKVVKTIILALTLTKPQLVSTNGMVVVTVPAGATSYLSSASADNDSDDGNGDDDEFWTMTIPKAAVAMVRDRSTGLQASNLWLCKASRLVVG